MYICKFLHQIYRHMEIIRNDVLCLGMRKLDQTNSNNNCLQFLVLSSMLKDIASKSVFQMCMGNIEFIGKGKLYLRHDFVFSARTCGQRGRVQVCLVGQQLSLSWSVHSGHFGASHFTGQVSSLAFLNFCWLQVKL